LGISDATYYNWRKQYGQMKLNQVKQLKAVQKENSRLKKLVAGFLAGAANPPQTSKVIETTNSEANWYVRKYNRTACVISIVNAVFIFFHFPKDSPR